MVIGFGKYRDRNIDDVYQSDRRYCRWFYSQELILNRNPELKAFLDDKFKGTDMSYELTFGRYKG